MLGHTRRVKTAFCEPTSRDRAGMGRRMARAAPVSDQVQVGLEMGLCQRASCPLASYRHRPIHPRAAEMWGMAERPNSRLSKMAATASECHQPWRCGRQRTSIHIMPGAPKAVDFHPASAGAQSRLRTEAISTKMRYRFRFGSGKPIFGKDD
jgi:hypothetical protein